MDKIDLPFFYQLGGAIHPLTDQSVQTMTHLQLYWLVNAAQARLGSLWPQLRLTVCKAAGDDLTEALSRIDRWRENVPPIPWVEQVSSDRMWQVHQVQAKATAFETVLTAELQGLPTYHATRKGIYSMPDLIDNAADVFPEGMRAKLTDEVREEIRQSGRCLAFDNATASGFHSMRAVESVMHSYYLAKCSPATTERLQNWGAYIAALHSLEGDSDAKRVVALLQQLKDHDRNLIMHPEINLTPDDALTLFEISQGAIMAMAEGLLSTNDPAASNLPRVQPAVMSGFAG